MAKIGFISKQFLTVKNLNIDEFIKLVITKVKNTVIVSVMDSMPLILGLGYYVTKGKNVEEPIYTNNIMNWKKQVRAQV